MVGAIYGPSTEYTADILATFLHENDAAEVDAGAGPLLRRSIVVHSGP